MKLRWSRCFFLYVCAASLLLSNQPSLAQKITSNELLQGLRIPERWLTYSGDYSGQRHSPLNQINTTNIQGLKTAWIFQTGVVGKFEATPLAIDGLLYVTGPENHAWALDARTGREIWHHIDNLPPMNVCCGKVNRGFAVYDDKLYMTTLDAH